MKKVFLPQRRKGAKKTIRNAAVLCAFAGETQLPPTPLVGAIVDSNVVGGVRVG